MVIYADVFCAFPFVLLKQLNAGLHVSLFLWIQSSSEWSFPDGFSRSPAPGVVCPVLHILKELCWQRLVLYGRLPKAWPSTDHYMYRLSYVKHCEWESICLSNLKIHYLLWYLLESVYYIMCVIITVIFIWDGRVFNLCNYCIINFVRTNSAFHFFLVSLLDLLNIFKF